MATGFSSATFAAFSAFAGLPRFLATGFSSTTFAAFSAFAGLPRFFAAGFSSAFLVGFSESIAVFSVFAGLPRFLAVDFSTDFVFLEDFTSFFSIFRPNKSPINSSLEAFSEYLTPIEFAMLNNSSIFNFFNLFSENFIIKAPKIFFAIV